MRQSLNIIQTCKNALKNKSLYKVETQTYFNRIDVQKFLKNQSNILLDINSIIPYYNSKGEFQNYFIFPYEEYRNYDTVATKQELNQVLLNLENFLVFDLTNDWKRTFLFKSFEQIELKKENFTMIQFNNMKLVHQEKKNRFYQQTFSFQFKNEFELLIGMKILRNYYKRDFEFIK